MQLQSCNSSPGRGPRPLGISADCHPRSCSFAAEVQAQVAHGQWDLSTTLSASTYTSRYSHRLTEVTSTAEQCCCTARQCDKNQRLHSCRHVSLLLLCTGGHVHHTYSTSLLVCGCTCWCMWFLLHCHCSVLSIGGNFHPCL